VEPCLSRRTMMALKGTKPGKTPLVPSGKGICEQTLKSAEVWKRMVGVRNNIQVSGGGREGLEDVETSVGLS